MVIARNGHLPDWSSPDDPARSFMSYNKRWEVPNGGSYGNLDVRNIAPVGWVGGICHFGQIQFYVQKK